MTRPIRWGILGTGAIARKFAAGLLHLPDARLAAVGSRSQGKAMTFAHHFGGERACGSYEEVVRDAGVDVVYVATPNAAHRGHCLLSLENGKPVLCEKPFALDAPQAQEVVALARRRGLFCMEAMWMRFVPIMGELDALLRAGAIGEARMITANLGFPFPEGASHRVFDPALGGGALLDLGVYPLSFASRLFGRPVRVSSHARVGATGVDEQVTALIDYAGGQQAVVTASLRSRLSNDATVLGTAGMIRVHAPLYCPESLSLVRSGPMIGRALSLRSLFAGLRNRNVTRRTRGNGYAHEALEVMRCLRRGQRESGIMPLDETLAIMETMDTIRSQWARGKEDSCASPSSAVATSPISI